MVFEVIIVDFDLEVLKVVCEWFVVKYVNCFSVEDVVVWFDVVLLDCVKVI